ncbi:MAG: alpha-L-fucosidase [Clostridiales bacterium]|nr:alpha-L-fucosidase [Clostridiales bacterium]
MDLLSKPEYLEQIAKTRDIRMGWWREARFGMFVHIGLYSALGRNEWAMAFESWPKSQYEKLADGLTIEEGSCDAWADLAQRAGMKYMVMTSRHHEGFSLWDSKANPFNSANFGPKRDIVREFVEACRKRDLRVGLYSSLMDWHHPDAGRAAFDSAARKRFCDYIYALNEELLTKYGKIDILWYDVPCPMESHEGWNSLEMNQRLRDIQPGIIINNRSLLPEDFSTPEESLSAGTDDWESCMTFNGISWGYVDSAQAAPYSYNTQRILRMLSQASSGGGNLLLNIGPGPDGSIPPEVVEPLEAVGSWLGKNGECAYGALKRCSYNFSNGVCSISAKGNTIYLWNWIWPKDGEIVISGFTSKLKFARFVSSKAPVLFKQEGFRIILKGLPKESPDPIANVATIAMEFEDEIKFTPFPARPELNNGRVWG